MDFGGFFSDCRAPPTCRMELGAKNCTLSTLRPIISGKNRIFFEKISIFKKSQKSLDFFRKKCAKKFVNSKKYVFCRRKKLKFLWNLRIRGNPVNLNFQPNRTIQPSAIRFKGLLPRYITLVDKTVQN